MTVTLIYIECLELQYPHDNFHQVRHRVQVMRYFRIRADSKIILNEAGRIELLPKAIIFLQPAGSEHIPSARLLSGLGTNLPVSTLGSLPPEIVPRVDSTPEKTRHSYTEQIKEQGAAGQG